VILLVGKTNGERGKGFSYLHDFAVAFVLFVPVLHCEASAPLSLVQIEKHLLLQLVLAIRNRHGVVVAIQTMNEGLEGEKDFKLFPQK
jgi:hypothetical protein